MIISGCFHWSPPFGCREKKKTKIKEDKTTIPRLVADKMIEKMGREILKMRNPDLSLFKCQQNTNIKIKQTSFSFHYLHFLSNQTEDNDSQTNTHTHKSERKRKQNSKSLPVRSFNSNKTKRKWKIFESVQTRNNEKKHSNPDLSNNDNYIEIYLFMGLLEMEVRFSLLCLWVYFLGKKYLKKK